MAGAPAIAPFRAQVPGAALDDLRDRLRRTRWPERETVGDWSQGVPLAYLRELCAYWADGYDWPATQARLNALPQFTTEIDGLPVHFVHVRSPRRFALPLILTHGWPGSVLEFLKVVGPLTAGPAAFDIVCPSLPGYGFSGKPGRAGWGVERIAAAWAELMLRLGYHRYGAAGTDWGTSISASIGQQDAEHVVGIHLIPPLAGPDPAAPGDLTAAERATLDALRHSADWESGYSAEHATKPQTIGYALTDSPVALCAWIAEKFRSWSDPASALTRDDILDAVSLYWFTQTGASAARLYWESIRQVNAWISGATSGTVDVPVGCTVFPHELQRPSRRWAARRFTDIRYWNEPAAGGHFPALEQPAQFVTELTAFFSQLR